MKFIFSKSKIIFILLILFNTSTIKSEELKKYKGLKSEHEFNLYSGMFDFSDDGKRSVIFGLQHQNENLVRESILGTLSPITGAMITADNASYFYTGVQAQYKVGKIDITPSFSPGLYNKGSGKDLGHIVQFKSEVQVSLDLFKQ